MNTLSEEKIFNWKELGNLQQGRKNLGPWTHVSVYRLMQFTLRATMNQQVGVEESNKIIISAGELAGDFFAREFLDMKLPFDEFISQLYNKLIELKIGILRIENSDLENMQFTLTVDDDLDCSGLPFSGETVCEYDEGFIAGIFKAYTGKNFQAKEVDCWASGGRTCRFDVKLK